MKVLVTGGAGYIGSAIAHYMVDRGVNVHVIDNLSTGSEKLLPEKVKFYKLDIGKEDAITKIIKNFSPDIIIHLAAFVEVEESVINPMKYYENNVLKSISFFKSCINANATKIIFSSTAAVYGDLDGKLFSENDEKNPSSPYGKTKLITEQVLNDLNNTNSIQSVIFRYFNVAGADQRLRTGQMKEPASHLIKIACETALNKREMLYIYGNDYNTKDGTCIRDYIHINDLAELHYKAAEYLIKGGKPVTLNCGYSRGFSVLDVVNKVKKISKNEFKVKIVDRRLGDAPEVVADATLCNKVLNWKPKNNDLDKIIKDAFEWEKIVHTKN